MAFCATCERRAREETSAHPHPFSLFCSVPFPGGGGAPFPVCPQGLGVPGPRRRGTHLLQLLMCWGHGARRGGAGRGAVAERTLLLMWSWEPPAELIHL